MLVSYVSVVLQPERRTLTCQLCICCVAAGKANPHLSAMYLLCCSQKGEPPLVSYVSVVLQPERRTLTEGEKNVCDAWCRNYKEERRRRSEYSSAVYENPAYISLEHR